MSGRGSATDVSCCVPTVLIINTTFLLANDADVPRFGPRFKGEVHDFYKTSWFVEFEALS